MIEGISLFLLSFSPFHFVNGEFSCIGINLVFIVLTKAHLYSISNLSVSVVNLYFINILSINSYLSL